MLSSSVQPPTAEHVYAQWQERKEPSSPLGLLQEDNGQSRDVKEEDSVSLMSGDPTSQNHFRSSRAVRLKGNAVKTEDAKIGSLLVHLSVFLPLCIYLCVGNRGRLSKADVDTGWSKDDERQCSLCQKYGDRKPNVSNEFNSTAVPCRQQSNKTIYNL